MRQSARTMQLSRRRLIEVAAPPLRGTLPCSEHSCNDETAISCGYRDRRRRACHVAFCPDHWSMVGEIVYCRRHASTLLALGRGTEVGALPELENRGASLVNAVANQIGPAVEELLRATAGQGETVTSESEVSVIVNHERRRRWERSWKLIEPTGINLKASVTVSEGEDDALVEVRVDSNVLVRVTPPWIARRRAGLRPGGQADADQREIFHRSLVDQIAHAVVEQRSARLDHRM